MDTQERLTILEAIDDLSAIVDYADWERELLESSGEEEAHSRKIAWLRDESYDEAMHHLKVIFATIYDYLRELDAEDDSELRHPHSQRGLRSMMLLVGEAARRLDRYTQLFHGALAGSVVQMEEFNKIQQFYKKRIEPKVQLENELIYGKEFDDLKKIELDLDYELFSLLHESGEPFMSSALVDQIKLAIGLRSYAEEQYRQDDPLIDLQLWKDRIAQVAARNLIQSIRPLVNRLYPINPSRRDDAMIAALSDALIALMLAANRKNGLASGAIKPSWNYFKDFQQLLRSSLSTAEYRKLINTPPKRSPFYQSVRDLFLNICFELYTQPRMTREMVGVIDKLTHSDDSFQSAADQFEREYLLLSERLADHPNGPLLMTYDQVVEGKSSSFDPLLQGNLPERLCGIKWGEEQCNLLRIPSPTTQRYVHKAALVEEFRTFLLTPQTVLLIDLQDRTSWKEYPRVKAIEEFEELSLAKQTDFYHQMSPYAETDEWPLFRLAFIEQLSTPGCGYHFSNRVKAELFPSFIESALDEIHALFFEGRERLSRNERIEIIDLLHFFIELKLLDQLKPDYFSFTCKDGLDIGSTEGVQFAALWELLSKGKIRPQLFEWLRVMLYGPTLLVRQRAVRISVVRRMVQLVGRVEETVQRVGCQGVTERFDPLYSKPISKGELVISLPADETF